MLHQVSTPVVAPVCVHSNSKLDFNKGLGTPGDQMCAQMSSLRSVPRKAPVVSKLCPGPPRGRSWQLAAEQSTSPSPLKKKCEQTGQED